MKNEYFDQEEADPDDFLLAEAREQGIIPGSCLFGGSQVMRLHGAGLDPCSKCPGPRERCGGRPMDVSPQEEERARRDDLRPLDNSIAAARKQMRANWNRQIMRIAAEEMENR